MLDLTTGEKKLDEDVVFFDGFLYIIVEYPFVRHGSDVRGSHLITYILDPEYDEPFTLASIAEMYPNVHKVIWEDALRGAVYNYGNHGTDKTKAEAWECIGKTLGYA